MVPDEDGEYDEYGYPEMHEEEVEVENTVFLTLHVLKGTEEHFEGDMTRVVKKFTAKGGKWGGTFVFDDSEAMGGAKTDYWTLKGTYKTDSASATLTPGPKNGPNAQGTAVITATKTGEAHEE